MYEENPVMMSLRPSWTKRNNQIRQHITVCFAPLVCAKDGHKPRKFRKQFTCRA